MSLRRLVLFGVISAVLATAGTGVWTLFLRPVSVQVSQVERDVPIEVFGLGTVEARVTSKVGFKVSGVLVDLRADVGERVAKGSVLGRLDDREQSARVARTRAAIAQAEANLQRATASVEKARANYANAKSISERRQKLVAEQHRLRLRPPKRRRPSRMRRSAISTWPPARSRWRAPPSTTRRPKGCRNRRRWTFTR